MIKIELFYYIVLTSYCFTYYLNFYGILNLSFAPVSMYGTLHRTIYYITSVYAQVSTAFIEKYKNVCLQSSHLLVTLLM